MPSFRDYVEVMSDYDYGRRRGVPGIYKATHKAFYKAFKCCGQVFSFGSMNQSCLVDGIGHYGADLKFTKLEGITLPPPRADAAHPLRGRR